MKLIAVLSICLLLSLHAANVVTEGNSNKSTKSKESNGNTESKVQENSVAKLTVIDLEKDENWESISKPKSTNFAQKTESEFETTPLTPSEGYSDNKKKKTEIEIKKNEEIRKNREKAEKEKMPKEVKVKQIPNTKVAKQPVVNPSISSKPAPTKEVSQEIRDLSVKGKSKSDSKRRNRLEKIGKNKKKKSHSGKFWKRNGNIKKNLKRKKTDFEKNIDTHISKRLEKLGEKTPFAPTPQQIQQAKLNFMQKHDNKTVNKGNNSTQPVGSSLITQVFEKIQHDFLAMKQEQLSIKQKLDLIFQKCGPNLENCANVNSFNTSLQIERERFANSWKKKNKGLRGRKHHSWN